MSTTLSKSTKIHHIIRLRHLLKRWRAKAALSSRRHVPSDVPAGHVAICVGPASRRFIVRTSHLNHPLFQKLLEEAADEYGFDNNRGPISLPCEESVFEDVLLFVHRSGSNMFGNFDEFRRFCHVDVRPGFGESWPLLEKSVW